MKPLIITGIVTVGFGCGRAWFDAIGPAGDAAGDSQCSGVHDEDADGIADDCDVCPHVADPAQPDGDGDRVGDLCDPNVLEPRERIAFFDPFTSLRTEWSFTGLVTFAEDRLVMNTVATTTQFAFFASTPANDLYELGGTLGVSGTPTRQIVLGVYEQQGPAGSYYCELWEPAADPFRVSYTLDGTSFAQVTSAAAQTPLGNAPLRMVLRHAPSRIDCETTWPATPQMIGGGTPTGIAPTFAGFGARHLLLELDYFIQIRSEP